MSGDTADLKDASTCLWRNANNKVIKTNICFEYILTAERFNVYKIIDLAGGEKMVGLESSMDNATAAKKVKAKEDPAEKKRLDAFNAKLRARKGPQPK